MGLAIGVPILPLSVYQPFILLTILFTKIHMGMVVFLPLYKKKYSLSPLAILMVTGLGYPDPFCVTSQLLNPPLQENCISLAPKIVKGMKM
jgi:hypothetical protein